MTTRGAAALMGGLLVGVTGGVVASVGSVAASGDSSGSSSWTVVIVVGAVAAYIGITLAAMGTVAIGVRWGMQDRDDQRAIDRLADE